MRNFSNYVLTRTTPKLFIQSDKFFKKSVIVYTYYLIIRRLSARLRFWIYRLKWRPCVRDWSRLRWPSINPRTAFKVKTSLTWSAGCFITTQRSSVHRPMKFLHFSCTVNKHEWTTTNSRNGTTTDVTENIRSNLMKTRTVTSCLHHRRRRETIESAIISRIRRGPIKILFLHRLVKAKALLVSFFFKVDLHLIMRPSL